MTNSAMKKKLNRVRRKLTNLAGVHKTKLAYAVAGVVFLGGLAAGAIWVTGTLAQTFTGPQCSAGNCSGVIGVGSGGNSLSIGTSTPIGDTKLFILASSTQSAGFVVKVLSPGSLTQNANDGIVKGNPLLLIRNDGKIGIGGFIGDTSTSTIVMTGNTKVNGTLAATALVGTLSGNLGAENIAAGSFGSVAGTGNYTFPASVGIGAAPGTTLDVSGQIRGTALNVTGATALSAGLVLSDEGSYKRIQSYENEPLLINPLGNNVSIATTSSAYALTVQGQINSSGGLCIAGDCKTNWGAVGNNSGWTDNGTTVTLTTGTDNVGINQAPSTKFHVGGDIAATGWIGAGCEGACEGSGGYSIMYGNGQIVATSRVDSPIFYDNDNTAYYVNPAAASNISSMTMASTLSFYGNQQIWNGDNSYIYVRSNSTASGMRFQNNAGTNHGYVYGDGGSFGFLTAAGSWAAYTDQSGNFFAVSSMRAPIFYDSQDTNFYADPNGTSYFNDFRPSVIYDRDNTAYYVDPNGNTYLNYAGRNYGFNWTEYDWNNSAYYVDPNNVSIYNDLRANIFYDYGNTGYYVDPNGTSITNVFRMNSMDCMGGYCPSNQVFRHTPDLHINSYNGYAVIVNWDQGTSGASQTFRVGNGASADAFYVLANGSTYAAAFYYTSDLRLKTDLKPASGLAVIKELNGYSFRWRNDGKKDVGLIAQEVEKVLPEAVSTNSDGMKTINSSALMAPMVEAIKELNEKVESQAALIEDLKREVGELKRR